MATKLLEFVTILSLFLALYSQMAMPLDIEEEEEYVFDAPFAHTHLRSRLLASIKKGKHCDSNKKNVCNGVSANRGASLLYCCKTHCRDVLSDKNNCGKCGHKCKFNERWCGGTCTNVAYNPYHCGKCNRKCSGGKRCEFGYCGYA